MDALRNYYERELAQLRQTALAFAEHYPKISSRLQLSGEQAADAHVERMFQSFALLSARVRERLEDEHLEFGRAFVGRLYPYFLRPVPSAAIVQFSAGAEASTSAMQLRPRGTILTTEPVQGVRCSFRTCADVKMLPLRIASVNYRSSITAPAGSSVPREATSVLSLHLELTSADADWNAFGLDCLRLYLDGETAQVTALREALALRSVGVMPQAGDGPWSAVLRHPQLSTPAVPVLAGYDDGEALLPGQVPGSASIYRLLTEYTAFPRRFDFIDLPCPRRWERGRRRLALHVLFKGIASDTHQAHLLEGIESEHVRLFCTPVINLFDCALDAITVRPGVDSYALTASQQPHHAFEVYSIDGVRGQTEGSSVATEFRPVHQLLTGDCSYWQALRDEEESGPSATGLRLAFVDEDCRPTVPDAKSIAVQITASNAELPHRAEGIADTTLKLADDKDAGARLLCRPSRPLRFDIGGRTLWHLINHLQSSPAMREGQDAQLLRDMLRLYGRWDTRGEQLADGLVSTGRKVIERWLYTGGQPSPVRGYEQQLIVDEQAFAEPGLSVFTELMARFFGGRSLARSVVELSILSSRDGAELARSPLRQGEIPPL